MNNDILSKIRNIPTILGVTKNILPPGNYTTRCRHSDCFVYVLTGGGEYTFGSRHVTVEPGGILYLANRSRYDIRITVPHYTFIYVDFFFEESGQQIFDNAFYAHPRIQALDHSFMELHRLWFTGTDSDRLYCKSLLYAIYSQIVATCMLSYIPSSRKEQMKAAVLYISEHYSDNELSIRQLASIAQMSEVHFRRLFRELYHTPPLKFLNDVRVNQAKLLLANRQMSVEGISEACGFSTACYFARVFKSVTGVSPTAYREIAAVYY